MPHYPLTRPPDVMTPNASPPPPPRLNFMFCSLSRVLRTTCPQASLSRRRCSPDTTKLPPRSFSVIRLRPAYMTSTSPATPPPTAQQTHLPQHDPPSLPTSPSSQPPGAKRAKTIEGEVKTAMASTDEQSSTVVPEGLQNPAATVTALRQEEAHSCVAALQVKRMSEKAKVPTRGSEGAAGLDLYSAEETTIPALSRALIPTHIRIACPPGTYGRVAPRSGLSVKHGLHAGAGVIDADYRGEVKVLLFNLSDEEYVVKEGERCAQLVLERCVRSGVCDVGDGELVETLRGVGGFGSTGQ